MPYGNMTHNSSNVSFTLPIWASSEPLHYEINVITYAAFEIVFWFRYRKIVCFENALSADNLSGTQSNGEHRWHEERK